MFQLHNSLKNATSYFASFSGIAKENIGKLAVLNAVYAPPNQHQINVNAWLPLWPEMDNLATHGIPRGVHDYQLSADAGSI